MCILVKALKTSTRIRKISVIAALSCASGILSSCRHYRAEEISESQLLALREDLNTDLERSLDIFFSSELSGELYESAFQGPSTEDLSENRHALGLSAGFFEQFRLRLKEETWKGWRKAGKSVCSVLRPYFKNGFKRPYYFAGFSGSAGAGLKGVAGVDFVWNLYEPMFSAFKYTGVEASFAAGSVGAGISTYLGAALANTDDVKSAWSGTFKSASFSVSFPVLADYLSIGGNGFSSVSKDGKLNYEVIGAAVVLDASFSLPTTLPVGLSAQKAVWQTDEGLNSKIYKIWNLAGIKTRRNGPGTCQGQCIGIGPSLDKAGVKFGTNTARAVELVKTIPLISPPPSNSPGLDKLALTAFSFGALKDSLHGKKICGF